MNRTLARHLLFFPARYARGEYVGRDLRDVRAFERLPLEEARREQWRRLVRALTRAARDIPYYGRLFGAAGVDPARLAHPEDLAAIPALDKDLIRRHEAELRNPRRPRVNMRSTSGSTGVPFVFEKDTSASSYMDAVMYHAYTWHGIEIGAPQARFWGVPLAAQARRQARLKDLVMNRIRCNAFELEDDALERFVGTLQRFQPEYFYGYPSLIHEFARFVDRRGLGRSLPPLKAVIGTGELVVPQQREDIERVLATRFVNEYGSTETGVIAFGCPRGSMHVMAHNLYVEVVRDGVPVVGEEGEVFVTEFHAHTTPFIRYRLNDRALLRAEPCACGLPLPVMDVVSGRVDSYLVTPSGRKVYDAVFAYTLKSHVEAFRAVQTAPAHVDVYLVPGPGYSPEVESHYADTLREKTFREVEFAFHHVAQLPRERSGKLRYFVSEVARPTNPSAAGAGQA